METFITNKWHAAVATHINTDTSGGNLLPSEYKQLPSLCRLSQNTDANIQDGLGLTIALTHYHWVQCNVP